MVMSSCRIYFFLFEERAVFRECCVAALGEQHKHDKKTKQKRSQKQYLDDRLKKDCKDSRRFLQTRCGGMYVPCSELKLPVP